MSRTAKAVDRYAQLCRIATSGHLLTASERAEFEALRPKCPHQIPEQCQDTCLEPEGEQLNQVPSEG